MFEKNEELHETCEKLWAELGANCQKGQLIPYSQIESITGLVYQARDWTPEWRHVMRKFRQRLEKDRQIVAWCETGVGLRLLTDSETLKVPGEKRQLRMLRQSKRLLNELETINPAKLTPHERLLRLAQGDRLMAQRKEIRASLREVRKTEVGPMRRLPTGSVLASAE